MQALSYSSILCKLGGNQVILVILTTTLLTQAPLQTPAPLHGSIEAQPILVREALAEIDATISTTVAGTPRTPLNGVTGAPAPVRRAIQALLWSDKAFFEAIQKLGNNAVTCYYLRTAEYIWWLYGRMQGWTSLGTMTLNMPTGSTPAPVRSAMTDWSRQAMKVNQLRQQYCGPPNNSGMTNAIDLQLIHKGQYAIAGLGPEFWKQRRDPITATTPITIPIIPTLGGGDYAPTLLAMLRDLDSRLTRDAKIELSPQGRACIWASAAVATTTSFAKLNASTHGAEQAQLAFIAAQATHCVGAAAIERDRAWAWLAADPARTRPLRVPLREPALTGVVGDPADIAVWALIGISLGFPAVGVAGGAALAH